MIARSRAAQPTNIYRAARQRQNISLVKASDDTRIRRDVLQSIERGDTGHLPTVYAAGLQRAYARYLRLGSDKRVGAVGRESGMVRPAGRHKEPLRGRPIITSVVSLRLAVAAAIILVVAYAGLQTYRFFAAPMLIVTKPDQQELLAYDPALEISGRTSPEANVFVGQQSVPLQPDGSFQTHITLRSGINDIEIRAVNTLGKVALHHITAVFIP